MDGYVRLGMFLEVAAYVATATLARRSGRREKDKQAMLSLLCIELLGQRLDPRPQVYSAMRCVDRSACARKQAHDKTCRKPEYTAHSHPL